MPQTTARLQFLLELSGSRTSRGRAGGEIRLVIFTAF
jgi:hypothetical protein